MKDFSEILKKSLSILSDGYNQAYGDVTKIVENISNAIVEIAGSGFALDISAVREDIRGTVFRIYFDTDILEEDAETILISHINIPSKGYPVKLGTFNSKTLSFTTEITIEDFEKLEAYFGGMLESPESPIIQAIGYALRSKGDAENDPS